jgi:hypothetical protein
VVSGDLGSGGGGFRDIRGGELVRALSVVWLRYIRRDGDFQGVCLVMCHLMALDGRPPGGGGMF